MEMKDVLKDSDKAERKISISAFMPISYKEFVDKNGLSVTKILVTAIKELMEAQ